MPFESASILRSRVATAVATLVRRFQVPCTVARLDVGPAPLLRRGMTMAPLLRRLGSATNGDGSMSYDRARAEPRTLASH